jgi:hypothetical protein
VTVWRDSGGFCEMWEVMRIKFRCRKICTSWVRTFALGLETSMETRNEWVGRLSVMQIFTPIEWG